MEALKGMGDACLKFETPVTGGNVSFYNQSPTRAVNPTPTIGYLLSESRADIASSEYLELVHQVALSPAPYFDLEEESKLQNTISSLIKNKLVESVHDISEGGLFVTLTESALPNQFGFEIKTDASIRKDAYLFGESQSRAVVSIKLENKALFEKELEKHYLRLENAKTELNETKREYEAYVSAEAFQKTLNKIQEYFRKFNFNYKLEIDAAPKEAAFAFKIIDINGQPRTFKNGLSEGQLHVLSICFFLAFLDIQSDKNQKIIVFDDPINSLDNSNIGYFVDLLFELKDEFSQFLIFTHHKTFFKFSQKKFKTSESQNQYGHEYIILRNEEQYGGSFLLKSKMDSL